MACKPEGRSEKRVAEACGSRTTRAVKPCGFHAVCGFRRPDGRGRVPPGLRSGLSLHRLLEERESLLTPV